MMLALRAIASPPARTRRPTPRPLVPTSASSSCLRCPMFVLPIADLIGTPSPKPEHRAEYPHPKSDAATRLRPHMIQGMSLNHFRSSAEASPTPARKNLPDLT